MLIVQPEESFSDCLCKELGGGGRQQWLAFEFAVAWANQAGVDKVFRSVEQFLSRNNRVRAILGLDFSSTSYEGLSRFLDLEDRYAGMETYVFHDENRSCTFHPKVFLFSNDSEARLFVGSNNMTGAGMDTNIEMTVGITRPLDDADIKKVGGILERWRNEESENRVKRLSRKFLEHLSSAGYVRTEAEIRCQRSEADYVQSRSPLFGRSKAADRDNANTSSGVHSSGEHASSANELLMRVRPRRDGTQLQISMRIYPIFFKDAKHVISLETGQRQKIGVSMRDSPNGRIPNTARFEAPELEGVRNPIALFKWVEESPKVLTYQIFDADDNADGARLYKKLYEGISRVPITHLESLSAEYTVLSKRDRDAAQWYRLH